MLFKAVLLFSTLLLSSLVEARSIDVENTDIIYGTDDRFEVDDYFDSNFVKKSESVAIKISTRKLSDNLQDPTLLNFAKRRLNQVIPQICSTEKFVNQVSVGDCSGFLIAPDKLVTAGHCIQSESDCADNKWVFGFKRDTTVFKKKNVYACKKIIAQKYAYDEKEVSDYAVIELDRKVEGRAPLTYRKMGIVHLDTPLLVIGHPLGLPMKIADGARVSRMSDMERERKIHSWFLRRNYFTANLDSYGGNSGSPVFNRDTGKVEGILIQGAEDFIYNEESRCLESKYLSNSHLNTYEKVMRINKVPGL